ncbi:MAG: Rrf2 family transcriptional regulator [Chloroflexi bacterium AL-W]|nr:Rrf2 family transcriptional regulator [Chloroflexi bacterium AL-N1]NOK65997.1 Rrf2 family transcriptional regulator [Chloroflexi bacterium AL-N10]NOK72878.1 Rrf2 family transcriptional regulator [Chloroflexi bacterium AL-N5]NOK79775.1 Rrf2 family transcriptional regulator [Chloroflexi bacterium AL-W]NOK88369.1 Rrf2 family transcriptional regulator [Chloroflexi bacterium AL-N15]
MKLSDGVEWSLHCAVVLASLPSEATLPGSALAEFHGVSESYLLKHLKALTKTGILESVSGPKGGYRLAKQAEDITLLDIVEAIEGTESAFRCREIRQRGPACLEPSAYKLPCAINATMLQAEQAWKAALRRQTLSDLVEHLGNNLDPRAIEKSGAWLQENVRC